jgi:hypothetical protein
LNSHIVGALVMAVTYGAEMLHPKEEKDFMATNKDRKVMADHHNGKYDNICLGSS